MVSVWVEINENELSVEAALAFLRTPSAGAISTFLGTTRDIFNGKKVQSLCYETYHPLAIKTLRSIIQEAIKSNPQLIGIFIQHRIGFVVVGEISVIVGVSSVHRKESFAVVEFLLEELKRRAEIWKLEVYEDGESEWKANCSCN